NANPDGTASTTDGGDVVLNAGDFSVTPVTVTGMTPSSGPLGTTVEVDLSGMDPSVRGLCCNIETDSQITVNGALMVKERTYESNKVVVSVPNNATSGPIVLRWHVPNANTDGSASSTDSGDVV